MLRNEQGTMVCRELERMQVLEVRWSSHACSSATTVAAVLVDHLDTALAAPFAFCHRNMCTIGSIRVVWPIDLDPFRRRPLRRGHRWISLLRVGVRSGWGGLSNPGGRVERERDAPTLLER